MHDFGRIINFLVEKNVNHKFMRQESGTEIVYTFWIYGFDRNDYTITDDLSGEMLVDLFIEEFGVDIIGDESYKVCKDRFGKVSHEILSFGTTINWKDSDVEIVFAHNKS